MIDTTHNLGASATFSPESAAADSSEASRAIPPHNFFESRTTPPLGTGETGVERASAFARSTSITPPASREGHFAILDRDSAEFSRLPQTVRDQVRMLLHAFDQIHSSQNIVVGCKIQAAAFGKGRGFSWQTLRRKYYQYIATWDWRDIMDRAKAGRTYWDQDSEVLPTEFLEYWKGLCQGNQRSCKPAWKKLIRQWRTWSCGDRRSAIPGFKACPPAAMGSDYPSGWSYSNLSRYKPSKFELKASRQGRSAAADYRPLVFTTRVGLEVGQFYLFDDLWHDFKVNVFGQRHAQRLLQFHVLDLFSGCNFARGFKPVIENEMTGATERLKEVEMVYLVIHILSTFGYRAEGTALVVEHGTAAIREQLERQLHDLTDGLVKVNRGGIEGASAFAGMYAGRGKGNFRFKAALESLGNLIHNETADIREIPGQTGSNSRLNAPEELYGRDKHNDALTKAIVADPALASLLRMPFLEYNQAIWAVNAIHDRINARTDHELEGWIEAGLVTNEFRFAPDQPWLPLANLLAMPSEKRNAIEAYLHTAESATNPLTRPRRLSPVEVFEGGRSNLVKLPSHKTAMLLYECVQDAAKERTVDSHLIEFEDRSLSPSPLRYLAKARNPGMPDQPLQDGQKYSTIVTPFDLDRLHLFDASGRYVGQCDRWKAVSRADTEALHRQCGQAAKIERELLEPVARRGADITRRRIDDLRHNASVLQAIDKGRAPVSTAGVSKSDFEDLETIGTPPSQNSSASEQERALDSLG